MIHFADVVGNHCIILSETVIHELITNYTKIYKRRKEKNSERKKEKKRKKKARERKKGKKNESGRKWGWDSEKKKKNERWRKEKKRKKAIVRDFSDKL